MIKKAFIIGLILSISTFLFYTHYSQAKQDTLTIGRVSDNPKKHSKKLKRFIDYVAANLSHIGIKDGKVLLAKNNRQMIKYLKEGKIDIVTETPYSTIIYIEKAGVEPFLRRWKKGVKSYYSNIFVRKDSGIASLEDLKGRVIAFEDPGSTSGYFLPKVAILKKGIELVELKDYKETPPADKVGYCFAHGEPNIAHWVHKGLVAAGSLSSIEYEEPDEVPPGFLMDFKVIHKTDAVPYNIISVRDNLDPKLLEEFKRVLMSMDRTEEGRQVMWKISKTLTFDEFPGGVEKLIKDFRKKFSYIEEEIEKEYGR